MFSRISLSLLRQADSTNSFDSLLAIVFGKSSRWHPVSTQSRWIWVLAGWLTLVYLCVVVHRRLLLMSSSLLLQPCPACLTLMLREIGGKWPNSCCFEECCFQDLWSILVKFLSTFFSRCFVKVRVVQSYNSTDIATAWKNFHFVLSEIRFPYG